MIADSLHFHLRNYWSDHDAQPDDPELRAGVHEDAAALPASTISPRTSRRRVALAIVAWLKITDFSAS